MLDKHFSLIQDIIFDFTSNKMFLSNLPEFYSGEQEFCKCGSVLSESRNGRIESKMVGVPPWSRCIAPIKSTS